MMKYFYSNGSGLFQDDTVFMHRAHGVTERFDGYENDMNHVLRSSLSPDLSPTEHLWEIMDQPVRQCSPSHQPNKAHSSCDQNLYRDMLF